MIAATLNRAAPLPTVCGELPPDCSNGSLESPHGCRFTGPLASQAKSVVALDFMDNLIEQNRVTNGHLGNIDFRWGDVDGGDACMHVSAV